MEAVSLGEEEDVSEGSASEVDVPESVVDSAWLLDRDSAVVSAAVLEGALLVVAASEERCSVDEGVSSLEVEPSWVVDSWAAVLLGWSVFVLEGSSDPEVADGGSLVSLVWLASGWVLVAWAAVSEGWSVVLASVGPAVGSVAESVEESPEPVLEEAPGVRLSCRLASWAMESDRLGLWLWIASLTLISPFTAGRRWPGQTPPPRETRPTPTRQTTAKAMRARRAHEVVRVSSRELASSESWNWVSFVNILSSPCVLSSPASML